MKISKIEIKAFHQFKDLTIDLTYPKGHLKEGKPLDKVCLIGQSGTGKTSLLELIPKFLYNYNTQLISKNVEKSILNNIEMSIQFGIDNEYSASVRFEEKIRKGSPVISRSWHNKRYKKNEDIDLNQILEFLNNEWLNNISTKAIYFPSNLNFDIEADKDYPFNEKAIIDFSKDKISAVWNLIFEKIQSYQERELQIRQEILRTIEQADNDIEIIKAALGKLEQWKQAEFNPVQDIAFNCLDDLLAPFKLKIKTELDIKIKDDIGFIKIKNFSNNEIPNGLWSTGTKQIVLSALPLYLLKPTHTVVLFDEPERSLYPDMQHLIVDSYSRLTKECQFFYAPIHP